MEVFCPTDVAGNPTLPRFGGFCISINIVISAHKLILKCRLPFLVHVT